MKSRKFYCFSPAVMLTTFIVEIFLAIIVLIKLPKTTSVLLGSTILGLLALFQLSEYAICRDLLWSGDTWGRIGFIAITLLPPLGVHLARTLTGKGAGVVSYLAYASGLVWIGLFASGDVIQGYECTSNYLIFQMSGDYGGSYFVYYYIWLVVAMIISLIHIMTAKKSKTGASLWLLMGYIAFVLPATAIWLLDNEASRGLPSIMCGFAAILAIVIAVKVLPLSVSNTSKKVRKKVK